MDSTNLSRQHQTTINQIASKLQSNQINIESLWLFGSQIKGTAKPWSDLDIAMISKDFSGDFATDFVRVKKIIRPLNQFIEPHPFLPSDFADPNNPLVDQIKTTGIQVV